MLWKIKIHKLVLRDDFKKIPPNHQKIIIQAIEKKLTLDPEAFGKPLRGEFSRYWRLRVNDYRVVYRFNKREVVVFVVKVGIRKDDTIYKELFARIKKL